MSKSVVGDFSETSVTNAKTTLDDLVDAAFAIGTPTELVFKLTMNITASEAAGGTTETFNMRIAGRAYHASTVNTTLKTNLAAIYTEWEDVVTDSGEYNTITSVEGTITITAVE